MFSINFGPKHNNKNSNQVENCIRIKSYHLFSCLNEFKQATADVDVIIVNLNV